MAYTTWSGPIRIGTSPDSAGTALAARTMPIAVTAVANTDLTVTVPRGRITTLLCFTSVAFGAATDATIQVGTTVGGAELVAAVSIKALGKIALTFVAATLGSFPIQTEGATLFIRIVQTGAASATGAATLVAEYLPVVA